MARTVNAPVCAAIVLILLTALPVRAQERLFILRYGGELSEVDTSDGSLGVVQRVTLLPPETRAIRVAGGRYLVLYARYPWPQTSLAVFDTRAFTTTVSPQSFPGAVLLEADDFRPRVFYRTETAIGVISPPTFAARELFSTRTELWDSRNVLLEYAEAAESLLLTRKIAVHQVEIVSIDVETGALRGVIPADGAPEALLVDNVGRRLYVPVRLAASFDVELRVYDLVSLELLAKTRSYKLPFEVSWQFDSMRQQVLVGVYNGQHGSGRGPWALSLDSKLKPQGRVDFAYLEFDQQSVHKLQLLPSTARDQTLAVIARGAVGPRESGQWQLGRGVLVAMDADHLKPTANVDLRVTGESYTTSITDAILLTPPPPPTPLEFTIDGSHVELTWQNPGDATHFVVEVGTVAGRSDLGVLHVGNTTTWSVDGVPSGTYYVRLQAGNDVGPSLPSNEVVITVP